MFQILQMAALCFSILAAVVALAVLARAFRLIRLAETRLEGLGASRNAESS